ncbi:MAG TPA: M15 family metallopeptidase [Candidatus Saccharimonadales bacterium]|nr:M15 family metallopeptidase [Candidatus Saccharimonadales bacterium]
MSHSHNPEQEPTVSTGFSGNHLEGELAQASSVDIYSDDLLRPIPVDQGEKVSGWKEVPLHENHEPLVPLGPFTDRDDIFTSSVYYGEHSNSPYAHPDNQLEGALVTMFARAEVADRLRSAQQLLPEGHHLIVLDSYRTLDVQQALYDHYFNALKAIHPDWDEQSLSAETQRYVSLPSQDQTRPSPHNTGGSVDLAIYRLPAEADQRVADIDLRLLELREQAPKDPSPAEEASDPILRELYLLEMEKIGLVRRQAEFLNFGTQFDHGGIEAQLDYFEWLAGGRALRPSEVESLAEGKLSQEMADFIQSGLARPLTAQETEARDNRRMLYNAMIGAGMQPYLDEWWHYNSPKSQMGAKVAGLDHAEYGGVELDEPQLKHEKMRAAHRSGLVRIQERMLQGLDNYHLAGKLDLTDPTYQELIRLNERALSQTGDPRLTYLPKAVIIEPQSEAA